ncbi:hypothetical protein MtrunA17_Chr7g0260921 [Medicago truncatula]|uniref:Transmembrane protein n=1 Tax=Medicago truncatula TaxID=3880 RepID=A0A396H5Z4_MEDTR|nr:hypothetical protein MtrunA17_Chr7g0260921 [Medicago truncatula]
MLYDCIRPFCFLLIVGLEIWGRVFSFVLYSFLVGGFSACLGTMEIFVFVSLSLPSRLVL